LPFSGAELATDSERPRADTIRTYVATRLFVDRAPATLATFLATTRVGIVDRFTDMLRNAPLHRLPQSRIIAPRLGEELSNNDRDR
jgi:hypothetical protein